jgi:O-antigen chain-terminating methyltransferase
VGSGRGEFLELCREANIPAKGVDLNELMINRCREKGLSVERADGLEHLKSIPDESLCALTAFQVIEHLSPEQIRQLIQAALIKLKPGGVIILETVNPDYLFAFKYFSIDLTHQRPIHSLTLQFLLEAAGFRNLEVRLSGLVEDEIKIMQEGDSKENSLLVHGYLDYAVVGWR